MLSVIIMDNGEPNVIKLTYENLYREVKDIEGAELLVATDWFERAKTVKNPYVCFVEADCLLSSGYFASQMGIIKKNTYLRKLAVFATATGTNSFGNRFFGYELNKRWSDEVQGVATKNESIEPVRIKKSSAPYPIQIAYIPGAIVRMTMLRAFLERNHVSKDYRTNLVRLSSVMSFDAWQHGGRIHINPNMTYVTTEDYVNDLSETPSPSQDLVDTFHKESI